MLILLAESLLILLLPFSDIYDRGKDAEDYGFVVAIVVTIFVDEDQDKDRHDDGRSTV